MKKSRILLAATASIALTLISSILAAPEAQAISITVGPTTYEIETVTGSFNDLQPILTSLPWWQNNGLAADLANGLGVQLGLPNNVNTGNQAPLFAISDTVGYYAWFDFFAGVATSTTTPNITTTVWATLAPVPIPAALWLFGSGLLGLVGIARRKKSA